MKIGFIGAGKVGYSLGKFFQTGGITVTGYFSRHQESAVDAALFTNSKYFETLEQLIKESDAIFITVPDDSIHKIYEQITQYNLFHKHICHCSGAMTSQEAFPEAQTYGAYGYSIHPLFPFSNKKNCYQELSDAFFCLEGSLEYLQFWSDLIHSLGPTVKIIEADHKVRYHAACSIASNLVCGLLQESIELLETCGFQENIARQAISTLVHNNIKNVLQNGCVQALTGPIERGDSQTVYKHLQCFDTALERDLYRVNATKVLMLAKEKNPKRAYESVEQVLQHDKEVIHYDKTDSCDIA